MIDMIDRIWLRAGVHVKVIAGPTRALKREERRLIAQKFNKFAMGI